MAARPGGYDLKAPASVSQWLRFLVVLVMSRRNRRSETTKNKIAGSGTRGIGRLVKRAGRGDRSCSKHLASTPYCLRNGQYDKIPGVQEGCSRTESFWDARSSLFSTVQNVLRTGRFCRQYRRFRQRTKSVSRVELAK